MEAIEFTTHSNGDIIKIPPGHEELQNKELRVIILIDERKREKSQIGKKIKILNLKTKGFKFSRDEANAR